MATVVNVQHGPQNNVVCQVHASAPNVTPARKRYKPYGDKRNTVPVTFPTTDHGFLEPTRRLHRPYLPQLV